MSPEEAPAAAPPRFTQEEIARPQTAEQMERGMHVAVEKVAGDKMFINMGPQHPSTHGVLRLGITVDGEVVTDAVPDIGYLHRGTEKLAENRTYPQIIVLTDRMDYLSAMLNNFGYVLTVEKLLGEVAKPPPRAEYIRVIMAELNRIASHLVFFGTYGIDIGAFTPFLYAFRERERILDLFEKVCGARMTYSYMRIGGVWADLPDGWVKECWGFVKWMEERLKEYDDLLTYNPIFQDRTRGVGVLPAETAIAYGVTGPSLRASGVNYDVRRADPYSIYPQLKFEVPLGKNGDCFDRYFCRVAEMAESLKIVRQCLEGLPDGPVMAKVPKILKPAPGEAIGHIESSRGDLAYQIVSDGSMRPAKMKVRGPSFVNLQALPVICKGWKVADVVAILGSIDIVLGEVDR